MFLVGSRSQSDADGFSGIDFVAVVRDGEVPASAARFRSVLKRTAGTLNREFPEGAVCDSSCSGGSRSCSPAFSRSSHPLAALRQRRAQRPRGSSPSEDISGDRVRLAGKVRRGESLLRRSADGRRVGEARPYREFLLELVGHDPDITLLELQGALAEAEGVRVHPSAISRALKKLGFTYKKSR